MPGDRSSYKLSCTDRALSRCFCGVLTALEQSALFGLAAQDDREPALRISDHHHLGVGRQRELLGGLDALPLEEILADARGHDPLEVGDALGLDPLALGFLLLLLEDELHL